MIVLLFLFLYKKTLCVSIEIISMVAWAGIEPATHGFSVHCSTNWATEPYIKWRSQRDLNSRSPVWQTGMLTTTPWDLNGCGRRTWTYDLRVMSPVSYQLLYPAIEKMAEKEGFEPPRLLHPVGFQDRSLQPDLGISPFNKIFSGGPNRTRTCDQPVMSREL